MVYSYIIELPLDFIYTLELNDPLIYYAVKPYR